MTYIWLAVVILLSIVEIMTTNLTTIWFVISGIVSLGLSFTKCEFFIQFGTFTILGILLLITTKKWLQGKLNQKKEYTNLDRVIGMTGIVTEEIDKNKLGEVKVDGKRWTAKADENLKVDSIVKILDIDGVKLNVKKEDD